MSCCEKCWRDADRESYLRNEDHHAAYRRLLAEHECTPEEQAGEAATECSQCERVACDQWTGECMACGHWPNKRRKGTS
jgi:hypothetical protein